MSTKPRSEPAPPGKLVLFTAEAAPTLEETHMMDDMTFSVEGANAKAASSEQIEALQTSAHLTVPFRQQGEGGFSLVTIDFAPGYLLPRHSHSSDCLYYIIEGSIVMGRRELGAGDGFFLPAEQPYSYRAGPEGVKLLEFRHRTRFDMKVHESDMDRFRDKALASMQAVAGEAPAR